MEDAAYILDQYLQDLQNLPAEIQYVFEELRNKEVKFHDLRKRIHHRDGQLHKFIRQHGSLQEAPKEAQYIPKIQADFARAIKIQDEKCQLADRAVELLDRHLQRLDNDMGKLQSEGLLTIEPQVNHRSTPSVSTPLSSTSAPRRSVPRALERAVSSSLPSSDAEGDDVADSHLYCFCQQVSYGDMVACDDTDCRYEWFHYGCVGLKAPPSGKWYCSECTTRRRHH